MSNSEKKYENQGLIVSWKRELCIHSAKCAEGLPDVFDPNRRPWIQLDKAEKQRIMDQIDQCPSGALSYQTEEGTSIPSTSSLEVENVKVQVIPNGPLAVHSTCEITMPDGSSLSKEKASFFCRCGASENKPFCDGNHKQVNFIG